MADGPEGYVSGLIWENPQTIVPDDSMVLKVVVAQQPKAADGLVVSVVAGPSALVGYGIAIVPAHLNSCVGLGRLSGYVVVRKEPVRPRAGGEFPVFRAIDYLPDARDRSRGMKRESNWFYPGEPARDLLLDVPE
jgi:hypothetical protein